MPVIRWVILSVLVLIGINTVPAEEPTPRNTWQIQCEGNSYFDADAIRTALSLDIPAQEATSPYVTSEQYNDVLSARIMRGYLHRGFPDVKVAISTAPSTGMITVRIDEGEQRCCGDIHVSGLTARECQFVASLINSASDQTNPLQQKNPLRKSQPALEYWKHASAMSFVKSAEQKYRQTIREALTAAGYPEAHFAIVCPETTVDDKLTVELRITVTNAGPPLRVGNITFTGLEQHSPEHLIEFLKLRSGMPLTLELRERIVRELLDSGRFLVAEVKHSTYFLDPEVPLKLQIRVREYDRIVALPQDMSESQQALLKLSNWLSGWATSDQDVHFKFTGSAEQATEVVQATVSPALHSFCNSAMGTGVPGQYCLDFVTSSTEGSLFTFSVTDSTGEVTMRRTVLLTKSMQGLLAWQSQKKWLHADLASLQATVSIHGIWQDESERRGRFKYKYGFKKHTEHSKGLKTDIAVTAAAVMDLFHGRIKSVSVQNGVQRLVMESGDLLLNSDNGAPQELNLKTDQARMELRSGTGLLAKELARLQDEMKDWPNQNQPGRTWTGLASMLLEDISLAQPNNGDALYVCLDLLSNEAAVARFDKGLETLKERRSMIIPPDRPAKTNSGFGLYSRLGFIGAATPPRSFPGRFVRLANLARVTGESQLLQRLLSDLLQSNQQGAVHCLLVARTLGTSDASGRVAKAGLERLSTVGFQRDMAPLIGEPCFFRELTCSLVTWLQQTSDEDVERIVRVAAPYLKNQDDQPINVRPLLVLIRSQRDRTPEEVLTSLLPVIWEGGLRNRVQASLETIVESAQKSKKSYFKSASQSIPAWRGFRAEMAEAKKKKDDSKRKKTPVRTGPVFRQLKIVSPGKDSDVE
ncbi:MAG: hypothetical protein ABGZ53_22135 [Fuerstiella sp.]